MYRQERFVSITQLAQNMFIIYVYPVKLEPKWPVPAKQFEETILFRRLLFLLLLLVL